jgi:hypothetical protein
MRHYFRLLAAISCFKNCSKENYMTNIANHPPQKVAPEVKQDVPASAPTKPDPKQTDAAAKAKA